MTDERLDEIRARIDAGGYDIAEALLASLDEARAEIGHLRAERDAAQAGGERFLADNVRLRAALEFYADRWSHHENEVANDMGDRARKALEGCE